MSPHRSLVLKAVMIRCLGAVLVIAGAASGGRVHAQTPVATLTSALTTRATDTTIHQLLAGTVERLLTLHTPTTYLHSDHLGSVVLGTDSEGEPRSRTSFTPTGGIRQGEGHPGDYGFTGQERDISSGLHHFKFRYLDAHSGRWVSPDPLFSLSTQSNIAWVGQSTAAYVYVAGRFINKADPNGLLFDETGKLQIVLEEQGRPDRTATGQKMENAGFRLARISKGSTGRLKSSDVKSAGFIGHTQFHSKTGERTQRFALPDSKGKFTQVSAEVMADRILAVFPNIETVVIMGCHAAARDGEEEGTARTMVEQVSARLKEKTGRNVAVYGGTGAVAFHGQHGTAFAKTDSGIHRGGVFGSKGGKDQKLVQKDKAKRTGRAFGK